MGTGHDINKNPLSATRFIIHTRAAVIRCIHWQLRNISDDDGDDVRGGKSDLGLLDEVVTHGVSASLLSYDLRLQTYRAPAINHGCCWRCGAFGDREEHRLLEF